MAIDQSDPRLQTPPPAFEGVEPRVDSFRPPTNHRGHRAAAIGGGLAVLGTVAGGAYLLGQGNSAEKVAVYAPDPGFSADSLSGPATTIAVLGEDGIVRLEPKPGGDATPAAHGPITESIASSASAFDTEPTMPERDPIVAYSEATDTFGMLPPAAFVESLDSSNDAQTIVERLVDIHTYAENNNNPDVLDEAFLGGFATPLGDISTGDADAISRFRSEERDPRYAIAREVAVDPNSVKIDGDIMTVEVRELKFNLHNVNGGLTEVEVSKYKLKLKKVTDPDTNQLIWVIASRTVTDPPEKLGSRLPNPAPTR